MEGPPAQSLKKIYWTFICYILGQILCTVCTAAEGEIAGLIIEISGRWVAESAPARPLALSDKVTIGQKIIREPAFAKGDSKTDTISIFLKSGAFLKRSSKDNSLDQPILITPPAEKPGMVSRIVSEVLQIFGRDDVRYVPMITRDPGDEKAPNLREAVLLLDSKKLDFTPAVTHLANGRYSVRLSATKSQPKKPNTPASNFILEWEIGKPAKVAVPDLLPGLYRATLLNADGSSGNSGVWILVCPPSTFERTAKLMAEAESVVDSWGPDASIEAKRSFLRAYLDVLANKKSN
jgi:hypothetical protein